jgi:hypothetical protein
MALVTVLIIVQMIPMDMPLRRLGHVMKRMRITMMEYCYQLTMTLTCAGDNSAPKVAKELHTTICILIAKARTELAMSNDNPTATVVASPSVNEQRHHDSKNHVITTNVTITNVIDNTLVSIVHQSPSVGRVCVNIRI